jgi:hypothetical protein
LVRIQQGGQYNYYGYRAVTVVVNACRQGFSPVLLRRTRFAEFLKPSAELGLKFVFGMKQFIPNAYWADIKTFPQA